MKIVKISPFILRTIKYTFFSFIPILIYVIWYAAYRDLRCLLNLTYLLPVNTTIIYSLEMAIFYFVYSFLDSISNMAFDLLSGIVYLLHFALPAIYGVVILVNWRYLHKFYFFNLLVGTTSLLIVIIEFIFPTAPPWYAFNYLDKSATEVIDIQCVSKSTYKDYMSIAVMTGVFYRIDELMNVNVFKSIWGSNAVIFGSFPSMHAAWPMCIYVANPYGRYHPIGLIHVIWISGAAIYSHHHYIIDLLGALAVVILCKYISGHLAPKLEKKIHHIEKDPNLPELETKVDQTAPIRV